MVGRRFWTIKKSETRGGSGEGGSGSGTESVRRKEKERFWRWKFSPVSKWKRSDFQVNVFDDLIFGVLYVVEAVVLVSTLCCFYICCGCNF